MTARTYHRWLASLGACAEACVYCRDYPTLREAWESPGCRPHWRKWLAMCVAPEAETTTWAAYEAAETTARAAYEAAVAPAWAAYEAAPATTWAAYEAAETTARASREAAVAPARAAYEAAVAAMLPTVEAAYAEWAAASGAEEGRGGA